MRTLLKMTRAQLHEHAICYFKQGGATEPDVVLVAHGQARLVFKDYGRFQGWFNRWVAPWLLDREVSALTALHDLEGIPCVYRRLDKQGVLMEYCPARPWRKVKPDDIAYERLERLIKAIHARGLAHADLRGAGNLLVNEHNQPYVIDFVSRVRRGRGWNRPWNWIYRQFILADYSALAKLRVRYASHLASQRDYELREPNTRFKRAVRRIGEGIRWLIRLFVAKP